MNDYHKNWLGIGIIIVLIILGLYFTKSRSGVELQGKLNVWLQNAQVQSDINVPAKAN